MWLLVLLLISVLFIVISTARFGLHPFLALLGAALLYGLLSLRLTPVQVVEAINEGFGATLGKIGLVILAGAVIGVFLEKSGGALRLAQAALKLTGPRRVPLAMSCLGYVVSIPVFCDAAFIVLSPLSRALCRAAGLSIAAGAIALSLGLYATHTMVPPTPGPVAAAAVLEADLGLVALYGLIAAAGAMLAGWLFALTVAARVEPASLHGDPIPEEKNATSPPENQEQRGPSVFAATLPIAVPLLLIFARSFSVYLADMPAALVQLLDFLGQPVIALVIGAILALWLPRRLDRSMFSTTGWVGEALVGAATIIFITGAGGAFGKVIQESGIALSVEHLLGGLAGGLWLPFIVAAALKTAQGSSTVALITTGGIVMPLLELLELTSPHARALAVVAIGAGSIMVSHANDSYFWVVTQLTGLSVRQGYRLQTFGSLIIGLVAMFVVWACSLFAL